MKHYGRSLAVVLLCACGSGAPPISAANVQGDAGGNTAPDATSPGTDGSSAPDAHGDSSSSGGGGSDGSSSTLSVLVTPSTTKLGLGRQALFSATVSGSKDTAVSWSVQEGAPGGTIDSTGLYTAPMTAGTYHIIAQSHAMASVSGGATAVVSSVGSCSSLPAAGTWDPASIAPVTFTDPNTGNFDGKSVSVVVDPFDPATVWLGTGYKGLFKSTDCGATFTHVNNGMNGTAIDQSVLWSMALDPVNQGVMYTVGAYGANGLWKSTNGGVDWVDLLPASSQYGQLLQGYFPGNVSMDISNPNHLVVTSHSPCAAPYNNGCLAESTDGGQTWPNIVETPLLWAEKGGVQVINATTWIWGTGGSQGGLYVTTNNGHTWTLALPPQQGDANGEFSTLPLGKASDGAYYISSLEGVLRSTDGVAWSQAWTNPAGPLTEGIAVSPTTIYAADGTSFYSAPLSDYGKWTSMQAPPGLRSDAAASFLAYNATYHILYASLWSGGLYRYVSN